MVFQYSDQQPHLANSLETMVLGKTVEGEDQYMLRKAIECHPSQFEFPVMKDGRKGADLQTYHCRLLFYSLSDELCSEGFNCGRKLGRGIDK